MNLQHFRVLTYLAHNPLFVDNSIGSGSIRFDRMPISHLRVAQMHDMGPLHNTHGLHGRVVGFLTLTFPEEQDWEIPTVPSRE